MNYNKFTTHRASFCTSFIFVFICSISFLVAQDTFQKKIKVGFNLSNMIITQDGGFICSGWAPGSGGQGSMLIKFDANGDTLWCKKYTDTSWNSLAFSVDETSDGGYVMVGKQYFSSQYDQDILLTRLDTVGNILWVRELGFGPSENGRDVIETSDGGFLLTGSMLRDTNYTTDMIAVKTDSQGNVEWSRSFVGTYSSVGWKVLELQNGGYVVHGRIYTDSVYSDLLTIRLTTEGDTLWTQTYGGSETEFSYSLIETAQHELAVVGTTSSYGAGQEDILLVLLDLNGNLLWSKSYGGLGGETGYAINQTNDGGYIIGGRSSSFGLESDMYLLKTNPSGELQWSKIFDQIDHAHATSIIALETGNFLVAGHSDHVLKIDPEGTINCTQTNSDVQTIAMDVPPQFTALPIIIDSTDMYSYGYNLVVSGIAPVETVCESISTINSMPKQSDVRLHPNPFQDMIQIESEEGVLGEFILNNLSGKVLKQGNAGGSSVYALDLFDLPSGVYILRIKSDNHWVVNKIVK